MSDEWGLMGTVKRLRAQINSAKAIHWKEAIEEGVYRCGHCYHAWPCATAKVLQGDEPAPRPTSEPGVCDLPPAVKREPITEALAVEVAVNRKNPQESAPFRDVPMDAERIATLRALLELCECSPAIDDDAPIPTTLRDILRDAGADEI